MKLTTYARAIAIKAMNSRKFNKKLAKSYVSLFLVFVLGIGSVAAWFTDTSKAYVESDILKLESASALRVNKGKQISNKFYIDDFFLEEASSVDGRNIFFPLTGSFTNNTSEMLFREGTAGDKRIKQKTVDGDQVNYYTHYVYKDIELTGTSDPTDVYIKSYEIKVEKSPGSKTFDVYRDELDIGYSEKTDASTGTTYKVPVSQSFAPECPIRIAFIQDSARDPKVIDPSARVIDYVTDTEAVESVNEEGSPTTKMTSVDSFSSYYYKNKPIIILTGKRAQTVTMVAWLEGTSTSCKDSYMGRKISIDVDIESNFPDMETITFVDRTKGDDDSTLNNTMYWVSNDDPIIALSYKDPFNTEEDRYKTVIMQPVEGSAVEGSNNKPTQWTAKIPKRATADISFYRLSKAADKATKGENYGTVYNAWHTYKNVNLQLTERARTKFLDSNNGDNGKLQESRVLKDSNGKSYNSLVYTAIHGNGYSKTTVTSERLQPGVGYWDYKAVGEEPTSPTTPPVVTGKAKVELKFDEHDVAPFINQNMSQNGYEMYVYTQDEEGNEARYQMSLIQNETKQYTTGVVQMNNGWSITKIVLVKPSDSSGNKTLYAETPYTEISGSTNYTMNYTYQPEYLAGDSLPHIKRVS